MKFYRLTPAFFQDYCPSCPEILKKPTRPHYVFVLTMRNLTFAVPLRSKLPSDRRYSFVADQGDAGLDFTKAVVITDRQRYVTSKAIQIRQHEFNMLKQNEFVVARRFEQFLNSYIKQIQRQQKNPNIPQPKWCTYSSLQYFHKELGL